MGESDIEALKELIEVHGWKIIVKDMADLAATAQREEGQKQFNGMDLAGRLATIVYNLPTRKRETK